MPHVCFLLIVTLFSKADAIISSYMKSLGNYLHSASKALGTIVLLKHAGTAALYPEVGLNCIIIGSQKGCPFFQESYKKCFSMKVVGVSGLQDLL